MTGEPGPPGPAGPPGPPTPAFTFNQLTPSASWVIVHGLGRYPSVEVVDSADTVVLGDIVYLDNNSIVITFTASFGGRAYCN